MRVFVCQDEEMSMLGEITHLQTLTDDLKTLTMDPHKLPASSEQVRLPGYRVHLILPGYSAEMSLLLPTSASEYTLFYSISFPLFS